MRFCETKQVGVPLFLIIKQKSKLDFLNFLYNQVRWSSLRGSKRLKKRIYERNRKKKMSLQDQKEYHYAKLKFCLPDTFRYAATLGPALTTSKPYIPDNSRPVAPHIVCKNVQNIYFFLFFFGKKRFPLFCPYEDTK